MRKKEKKKLDWKRKWDGCFNVKERRSMSQRHAKQRISKVKKKKTKKRKKKEEKSKMPHETPLKNDDETTQRHQNTVNRTRPLTGRRVKLTSDVSTVSQIEEIRCQFNDSWSEAWLLTDIWNALRSAVNSGPIFVARNCCLCHMLPGCAIFIVTFQSWYQARLIWPW